MQRVPLLMCVGGRQFLCALRVAIAATCHPRGDRRCALRVSPKPCARRYSRTIRASRREWERARALEERACTQMRAPACMHSILPLAPAPSPRALQDRPYAPRTPPLTHAQAFLTPSLASLGKIAPSTRAKCDAPSPRMRRPSTGIPHLQAVNCAQEH